MWWCQGHTPLQLLEFGLSWNRHSWLANCLVISSSISIHTHTQSKYKYAYYRHYYYLHQRASTLMSRHRQRTHTCRWPCGLAKLLNLLVLVSCHRFPPPSPMRRVEDAINSTWGRGWNARLLQGLQQSSTSIEYGTIFLSHQCSGYHRYISWKCSKRKLCKRWELSLSTKNQNSARTSLTDSLTDSENQNRACSS